jgi:anaerobic dimethyl sulfoxide reductase subunit B (iron-sulfur subunit)
MVEQYGFAFEPERCVQCHACEVACMSLNNVEPGLKWRRVVDLWKGQFPDVMNRTLSFSCMHCAEPACEAVCPTGAIQKRFEDGAVLVDSNKCIGCRACLITCPFGVPRFGSDGRMQKCDLCVDRISRGTEPMCVATCPSEALHFGPMRELTEHSMKRSAQKIIASFLSA